MLDHLDSQASVWWDGSRYTDLNQKRAHMKKTMLQTTLVGEKRRGDPKENGKITCWCTICLTPRESWWGGERGIGKFGNSLKRKIDRKRIKRMYMAEVDSKTVKWWQTVKKVCKTPKSISKISHLPSHCHVTCRCFRWNWCQAKACSPKVAQVYIYQMLFTWLLVSSRIYHANHLMTQRQRTSNYFLSSWSIFILYILYISAVKQLIASKIKVFVYVIYVYTVHIYVYKYI